MATHLVEYEPLRVIWVADDRDARAGEFVASLSIQGPWYTYASSLERQKLRVRGSPSLFLVAPGGVFVEQVSQDPSRLSKLPPDCREDSQEQGGI